MKKSVQLYDAGLDEYPVSRVIAANFATALIVTTGTLACWFISPWFGASYLAVSLAMVYIAIPRLVCRNCHYFGKRCAYGSGQLASVWFTRGRVEDFNEGAGFAVASLTYALMILVPLIALVLLILHAPTTTVVVLLAILLGMAFFSAGPGRRRTCSVCKMRLFCKGSAAK